MFPKSRLLAASAVVFIALQPNIALADPVLGTEALREYNLIVLGDLDSNSEVEGRTFVGGDLSGSSSNYNIQPVDPSANGQPGLTVVGNVTGDHKNLNNASGAVIGGNVESGFNLNGSPQTVQVGGSVANTNVNNNTVNSNLASSDPAFLMNLQQDASLLQLSMINLSDDLAAQTSNSSLIIDGNRGIFNAQPDADGYAVFNVSSADLNAFGEIQFALNGADTVIVNVSGTDILLNDNFLGGTQNFGENVIWNFPDATNLNLTTAWGGSVLAPRANATTSNYIQGSGVFGNLEQRGEMHVGTYMGSYTPTNNGPSSSSGGSSGGATPVPEPGMLGLLGMALLGLVFFRRRKKAKVAIA